MAKNDFSESPHADYDHGIPSQPRLWLSRFTRNNRYSDDDPDEDLTPKQIFESPGIKFDDSLPPDGEVLCLILQRDVIFHFDADEHCFHGLSFVYDVGWDCGTHVFILSPAVPFDPPCPATDQLTAGLRERLETDSENRLSRLVMEDLVSVLHAAGLPAKEFWDRHAEFCEQLRFYRASKSGKYKRIHLLRGQ